MMVQVRKVLREGGHVHVDFESVDPPVRGRGTYIHEYMRVQFFERESP